MNARQIAETVRAELDRRGVRPYRAAQMAGLPDNTFRYVLEERDTRLSKLVDVCDALDFEFYIGPRREAPASRGDAPPAVPVRDLERATRDLVRLTANAGGDPIPDDLWPVLAVRHGGGAPFAADENLPGAGPIDVVEFAAAAGGGAGAFDEAVSGRVWFRRDWLDRRGLDPVRCAVIGVRGGSMYRTLPDGCSILVDRQRTELVDEAIFVVRAEDGLAVKRARRGEGAGWAFVSEHGSRRPLPRSAVAEIVGQVVWMARALI
ncbi:MAG: S24 family peptidase [Defluviicoccus sp.]|nr:S24 family peptidase [Defluviicoccus sp.]MDE0275760.1 S24 family peptidase [Defluviicoccus sp.]